MADIKKEQNNIEVGETITAIEAFFEKNKKIIIIALSAIVILTGGLFLYKKAYIAPLEKEAQEQMFVAEQYFEKDSFNIALQGDGNNWGFLKIIDEYKLTPSANLAYYYAGISYLHLGEFDNAIKYLKKFDSNDRLIYPIALGAIGDAYSELANHEKALKYYLKAASKGDNEFLAPLYYMKAAIIHENQNNYRDALSIYKKIKKEYPRSNEARLIDKYISRAEVLLKK